MVDKLTFLFNVFASDAVAKQLSNCTIVISEDSELVLNAPHERLCSGPLALFLFYLLFSVEFVKLRRAEARKE